MEVAQTSYRDADSWLDEVYDASTTQAEVEWWDWKGGEEPEGLIHAILRDGTELMYMLAQRLRWKQTGDQDDIVKYRYLTGDELDDFIAAIRPSAELAEKASRFVTEFYTDLHEVNDKLDKAGMASGTLSMVMNFSLNCSLTESGTLANVSNADLRRVAHELMVHASQ